MCRSHARQAGWLMLRTHAAWWSTKLQQVPVPENQVHHSEGRNCWHSRRYGLAARSGTYSGTPGHRHWLTG
ncbi:hypothetical protein KC19_12G091400 [Ceratodon purpureus]|uniref:Secreted protein n=1 Tax=Ceratodon purpureus TaxID=3225 RepID=A0A8T0G586_CERPU|nr:hypothetical protein KC19_12G091400 [Ceratodon purpureus]